MRTLRPLLICLLCASGLARAMSCGDRLQKAEMVYIRLIEQSLKLGLVAPEMSSALEKGKLVDPLAKVNLRASDVALQNALNRTFRQLNGHISNEASLELRGLVRKFVVDHESRREARRETQKILSPSAIAEVPVETSEGLYGQFKFYRDRRHRVMLMQALPGGASVRLVDFLQTPATVRDFPIHNPKDHARSRRTQTFVSEGRPYALSILDAESSILILDNLEEGTSQNVNLEAKKPSLQILNREDQTWFVLSSPKTTQFFEMRDGVLKLAKTLVHPQLNKVRAFFTREGTLKIVGRDFNSLFIYEPLTQSDPTHSWTGISLLDEFASHLNSEDQVEICAVSLGDDNLQLFRESQPDFIEKIVNPTETHQMTNRTLSWSELGDGASVAVLTSARQSAVLWPRSNGPKIQVLPHSSSRADWIKSQNGHLFLSTFNHEFNLNNERHLYLVGEDHLQEISSYEGSGQEAGAVYQMPNGGFAFLTISDHRFRGKDLAGGSSLFSVGDSAVEMSRPDLSQQDQMYVAITHSRPNRLVIYRLYSEKQP